LRTFSERLPPSLVANAIARAVDARRRAGLDLVDLTESNPTRAGFQYPLDLFSPLADPAGLVYDPQPLGLPRAREAVAVHCSGSGRIVMPGNVTLTASTSEAYALLFKLFCDPGDRVLVPRPGYPLFDHLTRLEAVDSASYLLEYHGSWRVDLASVERALTVRTRALLVVSPNNPTGSVLHREDLLSLVDICRRHDLVLIGDEVFSDYWLDGPECPVSVLNQDEVLTCALGGLSKSCGLPQAKLGWIVWGGPEDQVSRALAAYEIVADSYLSVSTPVQVAAEALLTSGAAVRDQIRARIRRNLHALREACTRWPSATVLRTEGGWSAVVQVPAVRPEEELVVTLVANDGVLVHPGYFFDFAREAFVVLSLIVEPARFDEGVSRLLARACGGRP
jgi:aspartate/methionine/tyrosine aminotransferase